MSYHLPRWEAIQQEKGFRIERVMSAGPRRLVALVLSEESLRDAACIAHAPSCLTRSRR